MVRRCHLPITLLILVAAFGSLVAAGLPLLLGLTATVAAIGILGPVSHLLPVAESISSVVLLVGLAVGVDYSMFYIRRQRDERAAGHSNEEALEVAAATSGRAVLISGLTVMVAMSGMWVVGHPVFESFALGTAVPATIALLGDRIDKGRFGGTVSDVGRKTPRVGSLAEIGRIAEQCQLRGNVEPPRLVAAVAGSTGSAASAPRQGSAARRSRLIRRR